MAKFITAPVVHTEKVARGRGRKPVAEELRNRADRFTVKAAELLTQAKWLRKAAKYASKAEA